MRLHGIDRDVWNRYTKNSARSWEYDIVAPGYKYNLPDIAAVIGLAQLAKAEDLHRRRRDIAGRYIAALEDRDYLELPRASLGHSWHLFILSLRLDRLSIGRDEFMTALADRGIGTSVHYKPLHHMSYYQKTYGLRIDSFPRATRRFQRVMSLPIYPDLDSESVEYIISSIREIGDSAYIGRR
jgi:dTDP-4-amino-4,6-dideoxygalactose transaminase